MNHNSRYHENWKILYCDLKGKKVNHDHLIVQPSDWHSQLSTIKGGLNILGMTSLPCVFTHCSSPHTSITCRMSILCLKGTTILETWHKKQAFVHVSLLTWQRHKAFPAVTTTEVFGLLWLFKSKKLTLGGIIILLNFVALQDHGFEWYPYEKYFRYNTLTKRNREMNIWNSNRHHYVT